MNNINYDINRIEEFKEYIKTHKVPIPKYIYQLLDKLERDLKLDGVRLDLKEGNKAIYFIEKTQNMKLSYWQKFVTFVMFGVYIGNKLYYREIVLVIARGNGKTPFSSGILSYSWLAKGENKREFFTFASNKKQASVAFDYLSQIVEKEAFVSLGFESQGRGENSKIVNIRDKSFKCWVLPFESNNVQSLNAGMIYIDEFHTMQKLDVYMQLRKGLKQPTSQLLATSTAGEVDNGLYDYYIDRAESVLKEHTGDRLLPFLFIADNPVNWYKEEEIIKANPSWYEDWFSGNKENILQDLREARNGSVEQKENFFKYNLNLKVAGNKKFFEHEDFNYNHYYDKLPNDIEWYVGIDLATWQDLSSVALYGYSYETKKHYIISKSFVSEKGYKEHKQKQKFPMSLYKKQGLLDVVGNEQTNNYELVMWLKDLIIEKNLKVNYIGYDPSNAGELEYWLNDEMGWYEISHLTKVVTTPNVMTYSMVRTRELLQERKIFFNSEFLKNQLLNISHIEERKGSVVMYKPDNKNKFNLHDEAVAVFYALTTKQRYEKMINNNNNSYKRRV